LVNYNDEFFYDFSNASLVNLDFYSNNSNVDLIEDNYEFLKNSIFLFHSMYKNPFLSSLNYILPNSYVNVLTAFRADFSEPN
jgi:hypothetical protein